MEHEEDRIDALAITSDGKDVLLGTVQTYDVHFYDPVTGQKVKTIRGMCRQVMGGDPFSSLSCNVGRTPEQINLIWRELARGMTS